jgi:transcription elongation factor Elf1
MKHKRRKPTKEELMGEPEMNELEGEFLICQVCGESGEGVITLQNEEGFAICSNCIDGLASILVQVRRDLSESGDLYEHRSLN